MRQTQAASNRLASDTRRRVIALWALVDSGDLDPSGFRVLATAAVAQANTAGVGLGDIGLASEITSQLRVPTTALGLTPNSVQVDQDRMVRDIDRILSDHQAAEADPSDALGNWAASEPLLTVASTVQTAMVERGIGGWVRVLSGVSCTLCEGWADDVVRSPDTPMARHVGCDCLQQPVWT